MSGAAAAPAGEPTTRDRFRGCLLGLAVGDALGTTLEFKPSRHFPSRSRTWSAAGHLVLSPASGLTTHQWRLCLAASLIERGGFDAAWIRCRRYVRWRREGYLSPTGSCFDIGNTVSECACRGSSERTGNPYSGSSDAFSAGNGSLMRLAPVPMYYATDAAEAIAMAAESSRTTHKAQEAVDACRYFAGLLVGALHGVGKEALLSPGYCPVEGPWERDPLAEEIARIADGSFKDMDPPDIRGTGYVVKSLEAALWASHRSDTFREGALLAVNLGDDADTTGAIYGQIAGAHYGAQAIPAAWRHKLAMTNDITSLADHFHDQAILY